MPVPAPLAHSPVKEISSESLAVLGARYMQLFEQYRSDRRIAEIRWLRNQRQYLGVYDPEIEAEMNVNRSKAYPRITRVKCITVTSHLMNLMFPGNERNWELTPAPDPSIAEEDVAEAIQNAKAKDQAAGVPETPMTLQYAMDAIHQLMCDRAEKLSVVIDDQMQELGGGQDYDYIALNREVIQSGVQYGMGVLRGPYAVKSKSVVWSMDDQIDGGPMPVPKSITTYKPVYEFVSVWDFYPDLAAKTFASMDGYFLRKVMSKSQVRGLSKRSDFMCEQITKYLANYPKGNYIPLEFEQELRVMGVRTNVNEMKQDSQKYQVLVWCGKIDGQQLRDVGADVDEDKLTEELDAEVWLIDGNVIKCTIDPWKKLGVDVKTIHPFLYDKDDTSPVGFGLPNAIRDSQMMIAAATRMVLDNASVTCGPNVELNTDLLRADQDLTSIRSYRIWYREGTGPEAQFPAVRNVQIDSHIPDLLKIVELGMKFADTETFVGPANGGDPSEAPSEPMRTAAGASMLRSNAALPFKDMVRGFDSFTQSVITSMVAFNRVFNPTKVHEGDFNVIARGATSLIAKEMKGMQADQLVTTLTPEEKVYVDSKKLLSYRLRARDMDDVMVSDIEAARRQAQQDQKDEKDEANQDELFQANLRKLLSDGYKNIAAGQKNVSAADAQTVTSFLDLLERGMTINGTAGAQDPNAAGGPPQAGDTGAGGQAPGGQGQLPGGGGAPQIAGPQV